MVACSGWQGLVLVGVGPRIPWCTGALHAFSSRHLCWLDRLPLRAQHPSRCLWWIAAAISICFVLFIMPALVADRPCFSAGCLGVGRAPSSFFLPLGRDGTLCPHGGFLYPLLRWAPRLGLPE